MKLFLVIYACSLSIAMAKPYSNLSIPAVVDFKNKNVSIKRLLFTFESFTPQGLRLTIDNATGIDLIAFDGKINLPIRRLEEGNLPWQVIRPTENMLTMEFPESQLQTGDVINYWVRIQYNGLSLYAENIRHIVKDILPMPSTLQNSEKPNSQSAIAADNNPTIITHIRRPENQNTDTSDTQPSFYDSRPITNTNNRGGQGCACDETTLKDIWAQLNKTSGKLHDLGETVKPLEEKIADLTETLDELVTHVNIGTKLLLTGNLPVRTNPVEDVRHLLIEKLNLLDLSSHILQAAYTLDGISFEMESPIDKLRILKRSKAILSRLTYKIVDPESSDVDIRSD